MDEITTLREMRPAAPPAELEAMRMAARERFVAGKPSRRTRQRWRLPVLTGGLTAAATAAAAVALVLAGGPAAVPGPHAAAGYTRSVVTAAWTVRENASGTVTIYLQEYANPARLQQTLQADGVNAIVRQIPTVSRTIGNQTLPFPTCNYNTLSDRAPQAVQLAVWSVANKGQILPARFIIHPAAMPPGSALFLPFLNGVPPKMGNTTGIGTLKPTVLNSDTVPACVPNPKIPASGGLPSPQKG